MQKVKCVFAPHHCVREEENGVQGSQEQRGLLFILKQMIVLPCLGQSQRTCFISIQLMMEFSQRTCLVSKNDYWTFLEMTLLLFNEHLCLGGTLHCIGSRVTHSPDQGRDSHSGRTASTGLRCSLSHYWTSSWTHAATHSWRHRKGAGQVQTLVLKVWKIEATKEITRHKRTLLIMSYQGKEARP